MTRPPRPAARRRRPRGRDRRAARSAHGRRTRTSRRTASGTPPPGCPAPGGRPCGRTWGPAVEIGRIPGQRKEVSGFVSSARYPGVAWMVRDSGNPAVLYSFELAAGETSDPLPGLSRPGSQQRRLGGPRLHHRARRAGPPLDRRQRQPAHRPEDAVGGPRTGSRPRRGGDGRGPLPLGLSRRARTATSTPRPPSSSAGSSSWSRRPSPSRAYRFDQPLDPSAVNRPALVATVPAGIKMVLGSTTADERLLVTSSTRNQTAWVYANRHDPPDVTGLLRPASAVQPQTVTLAAGGGRLLPLRRLRHRAPVGAAERLALKQPELTADRRPPNSRGRSRDRSPAGPEGRCCPVVMSRNGIGDDEP